MSQRTPPEGFIDDRTPQQIADDLTEAIFHVLDAEPAVDPGAYERYAIAKRAACRACRQLLADE